MNYGGETLKKVGTGTAVQIHGKDEWASIYHPTDRVVTFVNLKASVLSFTIPIRNSFNPYFIPQVVMPNNNTVIISDLNKKGVPGIIYYDRLTKKLSVLYKASNAATKLELCLSNEELFMGEFGLDPLYAGSLISKVKINAIDFSKREIIYQSTLNDIGNIQCQKGVLFIQNLSKSQKKMAYEVVILEGKKVRVLSDVNFASQIINMDGTLLLPYLGKYHVLRGMSDFTKADVLKTKENKK